MRYLVKDQHGVDVNYVEAKTPEELAKMQKRWPAYTFLPTPSVEKVDR